MSNRALIGFFATILSLSGCLTSRAQTVEEFYRGRTITLYVPSAAGGVNDLSARLVAQHLPRYLPGQPTIIVSNVPGAGGLTLANRLFNTLPRDGSVLSVLERGTPQSAIAGDPAAKFDPQALVWLGSVSSYRDDAYLLEVNASYPANTLADLQRSGGRGPKLGTSGPGATNRTIPLIAKHVFKLNLELVRGYTGAPAIALAQQRNEIDGQITSLSFLKSNQDAEWKAGRYRPLVAFGRLARHPELPDVPTARELATTDADRGLIYFAEFPFFMSLPIAAPPDIPTERAAALRAAFMAMSRDEAFLAAGRALKLEMSPIGGDEVQSLIAKAAQTPAEIIRKYDELVGGQ